MKRSLVILASWIVAYLLGTIFPLTYAQTARLDGDSENSLKQVYVQRVGAEVENSIQAVNGNWRITDDGVIYATQIVLEPQPLTSLLPVDGAMIFLTSTFEIVFWSDGMMHASDLIPWEDWDTLTEDQLNNCDYALYYNGTRYLAMTDNWMVQ